MAIALFGVLSTISAGFAIFFRRKKNQRAYAISKPIATILIITLAVLLNTERESHYGWAVILGLIFSLVGDILLLKERLFVHGLTAFLFAHIVFIYAFSSLFGFQMNFLILATLVMIGLIYFRFLLPHLKAFAIPVALYFLAIITMDYQAIGLSFSEQRGIFYLLGLSALLFSFSDAIIAYKKFIKDFNFSEVLILSTYWTAIFIISASIAYV